MLRATEYLCAAAALKNGAYVYPRQEIDEIWKTLLLNQFHDILPGSAIVWVHRQARAEVRPRHQPSQDDRRRGVPRHRRGRTRCDMLVTHATVPTCGAEPRLNWTVTDADDHAAAAAPVAIERDGERTVLDNGLVRVVVEADGTVSSLIDLTSRREQVPAGTRMGRYELLDNEPFHWDAWEIQRDAFLTAHGWTNPRRTRRHDARRVVRGPRRRTERGRRDRHRHHAQTGLQDVGVRRTGDWHAQEEFLKVDMPVGVQAANAQYECQYGMVERPIQKNSRGDEAKFESCTHRFVRVADAAYAVAVVNASTYGSDVSPIHAETADGHARGTMIRSRCSPRRCTPIRARIRDATTSPGAWSRMRV